MIMRQVINGVQIEGMQVRTEEFSVLISPGQFIIPNVGKAVIEEEIRLDFPPSENISDIEIGFDIFGRLYVDRHERGVTSEYDSFPKLSHYVYFTIGPDTESLDDVLVHVLFPGRGG